MREQKTKTTAREQLWPFRDYLGRRGLVRFLLTNRGSDVCIPRYARTGALITAPLYPRDPEINWIPPVGNAARTHRTPTARPRIPAPRGAQRTEGGGGSGRAWGGAERFSCSRCNFC